MSAHSRRTWARALAITDVGVAGLQRLTTALPQIERADVIVALAGMEGALPTVLGRSGFGPHRRRSHLGRLRRRARRSHRAAVDDGLVRSGNRRRRHRQRLRRSVRRAPDALAAMTTTPPTTLYLDPSFRCVRRHAARNPGWARSRPRSGLRRPRRARPRRLVDNPVHLATGRPERHPGRGHRPPAAHDHDQERHRSQPTRRWSAIDHLIATASLPDRVREGARATFRRLGEIEADAPRGVDRTRSTSTRSGRWTPSSTSSVCGSLCTTSGRRALSSGRSVSATERYAGAHGMLPLPAPATASLLAGAPIRSIDVELETCTPTGAALLATIGEWGLIPSGTLVASARGAGGRDPATHPNVISGHLIEPASTPVPVPASSQAAVILETNLDDVTPEVLGYLIDRLLAAGADDAWITPIVMKKTRPAHRLAVLASPALGAELRAIISAETRTLGIREIIVEQVPTRPPNRTCRARRALDPDQGRPAWGQTGTR